MPPSRPLPKPLHRPPRRRRHQPPVHRRLLPRRPFRQELPFCPPFPLTHRRQPSLLHLHSPLPASLRQRLPPLPSRVLRRRRPRKRNIDSPQMKRSAFVGRSFCFDPQWFCQTYSSKSVFGSLRSNSLIQALRKRTSWPSHCNFRPPGTSVRPLPPSLPPSIPEPGPPQTR